MTPLISIVIPVYNAARFLRAALDSVAAQSYARLEIIMVNDGSSDDSEEICREYCRMDSRFRLICQKNQGVSAARNHGIKEAKGEWIAFMDADDLLPKNSIRTLLDAAVGSDTKIAVGKFARDMGRKPSHGPLSCRAVTSEEAIMLGLYQKRILNSPCGVLYHESVLKEGEPLEFRNCRYEDLDFFYRAFERTDRICLVDDVVYLYRDNPDSFINTWSESRLDALDVTDRIVEHMRTKSMRLHRAALDRRFSAHFNILLLMLHHSIDLPEQRERCLKVIHGQRLDELKDPNVRLKNKLGALASYFGMPVLKLMARMM